MGVAGAAVAVTLVFGFVNGFHDSANVTAVLIATRAARPGPALAWASLFHLLGPLLAGTAVAATVAGLIDVPAQDTVPVVGAAVTGALVWNLATWWLGLPASASHGLVGGLAGAAMASSGPTAVHWLGVKGIGPSGVVGVLIWLALSPVVAGLLAATAVRAARWTVAGVRRDTARATVKVGEWAAAGGLAFVHGSNDAQKAMGLITLVLVASGHLASFSVPLWVTAASATVLTAGTAMGGWRVVRTIGRKIYKMGPLEGLVSQGSAAAVIGAAALVGAPVSTTDVVAPAVVGVGLGRRPRHVRWGVAKDIGWAFLATIPASGLLAAACLPLWKQL